MMQHLKRINYLHTIFKGRAKILDLCSWIRNDILKFSTVVAEVRTRHKVRCSLNVKSSIPKPFVFSFECHPNSTNWKRLRCKEIITGHLIPSLPASLDLNLRLNSEVHDFTSIPSFNEQIGKVPFFFFSFSF